MTVLFLVFFVENNEYHEDLLKNNIFDTILKFTEINQNNPLGFRLASGFILRELYKDRPDYIEKIV